MGGTSHNPCLPIGPSRKPGTKNSTATLLTALQESLGYDPADMPKREVQEILALLNNVFLDADYLKSHWE